MPHVRDGELHAYLDGALDRLGPEVAERVREHLAGCTDCQAKVEQEREVREEASALLERALPGEIVPPPFEELRRRAAVGANDEAAVESEEDTANTERPTVPLARPSTSFPAAKWAWAASLVLALGTGWMMGGGSLDFRDFPQAPGLGSEASILEESFEAADAPADEANEATRGTADLQAGAGEAGFRDEVPAAAAVGAAQVPAADARSEAVAAPQESAPEPQTAAAREVQEPRALERRRNQTAAAEPVVEREQRAPLAAAPPPPVALDRVAEADQSLQDDNRAAGLLASASGVAADGGPVVLPNAPVVAVLRNTSDGQIGVLQQLPTGDSVLIMWAGDEVATTELERLSQTVATESEEDALGRSDALASSNQPAQSPSRTTSEDRDAQVRQKVAATTQGARLLEATVTAPAISLGRSELWPTVVQVRRGSGVLTVYGTSSQEQLQEVLRASGLAN